MKNKILSLFLFLSLIEGCKKTDGVTTPPVTIKPVIDAIQPITGGYGTLDTLIGTNFLTKDSVKFNGVSAVVKYSSTDTIIAIVPKGAGTGTVSIVVNGDTVVGQVFKYIYTANVTTFVGNGQRSGKIDGQGANASFISPYTIIADKAGNLYVTDEGAYGDENVNIGEAYIRRIKISDSTITTVAGTDSTGYLDGTGSGAVLGSPYGMALDASGNIVFADEVENRVRKMTPAGVVTTIAGNGVRGYADGDAANAEFHQPSQLALDSKGNIYVTESETRIRKITANGTTVSTYAGSAIAGSADGTLTTATLNYPGAIVNDGKDNFYFVTDFSRIREMTVGDNIITISGFSGNQSYIDGPVASASFNTPNGLAVDAKGNIYIADTENSVIRMISADLSTVTTIAGNGMQGYRDGPAAQAEFYFPESIAIDANGVLYVVDNGDYSIRKITME